MPIAVTIAAKTVYAILSILWVLLLVEAVLSWFEAARSHRIYEFIKTITEPVVAPVRLLLHKFDFFRNLPIDFSHLFTMVIITALQTIVTIWI